MENVLLLKMQLYFLLGYLLSRAEVTVGGETQRKGKADEAKPGLLGAAAIGETVSAVGHDLKAPLQVMSNSIYSANEVVQSSSMAASEKEELLKLHSTISNQIDYMNRVIVDLQEYARAMKPEKSQVDLNAFVKESVASVAVPANVNVEVSVAGAQIAFTDSTMMKRLFANLINNAVQAMPEGGKIAVNAFNDSNRLIISIKDAGTGISEENMARLFRSTFTTKQKGTGLGLLICKRIVEALDGLMIVDSKEGAGTAFTVVVDSKEGAGTAFTMTCPPSIDQDSQ